MSHSNRKMVGCAACGATNPVPASKLPAEGACGRCGTALGARELAVLTPKHFAALAERSDIPLLVDFWAPGCGSCRKMAPEFSAAANRLAPALQLGKVNIEGEPGLVQRYGIHSVPTLMIIHKGHEIARRSGAMPTMAIIDWAKDAITYRGFTSL